MFCSGCGKDSPFVGDVCPYCQRKKSKDQTYVVFAMILGPIFAFLGYKVFDFGGAVGGFILGGVIAYIASGTGHTKPPEVATKNDISDEQRLIKLKELHDKGLINESEYNNKRHEILGEL